MIEIFALVGVITVVCGVILGVILISAWIRDVVEHKMYKYKIAHRWKKKPIAKCYCRDCKYWDEKRVVCNRTDLVIPSCGFCWDAEPKGLGKESDSELCRLFGAKYASRDDLTWVKRNLIPDYIELWDCKPIKDDIDGYYYSEVGVYGLNCGSIALISTKFFPSIKSGECVEVKSNE